MEMTLEQAASYGELVTATKEVAAMFREIYDLRFDGKVYVSFGLPVGPQYRDLSCDVTPSFSLEAFRSGRKRLRLGEVDSLSLEPVLWGSDYKDRLEAQVESHRVYHEQVLCCNIPGTIEFFQGDYKTLLFTRTPEVAADALGYLFHNLEPFKRIQRAFDDEFKQNLVQLESAYPGGDLTAVSNVHPVQLIDLPLDDMVAFLQVQPYRISGDDVRR